MDAPKLTLHNLLENYPLFSNHLKDCDFFKHFNNVLKNKFFNKQAVVQNEFLNEFQNFYTTE